MRARRRGLCGRVARHAKASVCVPVTTRGGKTKRQARSRSNDGGEEGEGRDILVNVQRDESY